MTSKAKKWMVGNLSSDDKTILGCEDNRCNNTTDNQQLAMASPTEVVKTKKSPSFSDSHHLFDAVRKGKIHLTRFILAASPNKLQNSWDPDGRTPLIVCCDIKEEGTRDQIVYILLESGADVNMADSQGRTALIHACEKRCNDIVRILIHHHNVKPDVEDCLGNTALIYSAAVGNDVATELLVRNFRRLGLQVDHYNKDGNTAILVAARNGNLNCAKILAQKGRASLVLKDKERHLTPLEWCLQQGYQKDEVEFLKPVTRFYRVAKLATSLSRSRSSVCASHASHPQDSSAKTCRFSPSPSLDSGMSSKRDIRARTQGNKACLGRSKSQVMDSTRLKDAELFGADNDSTACLPRQHTIDVPTLNHSFQKMGSSLVDCASVQQLPSEESSGSGNGLSGRDVSSPKDSDHENFSSDFSGESSDLVMIDDVEDETQEDTTKLPQRCSSAPASDCFYARPGDNSNSQLRCKVGALNLTESSATSPSDEKSDGVGQQQKTVFKEDGNIDNKNVQNAAIVISPKATNGTERKTDGGQTPVFATKTVAPLCEAEKEEEDDFHGDDDSAGSSHEDGAGRRGDSPCVSPDTDWLPAVSEATGDDDRCGGSRGPERSVSGPAAGTEILHSQKLLDVSSA